MKLKDLVGGLGSKAHAELIARNQEMPGKVKLITVRKLFDAVRKSTLPQRDIDAIIDAVGKDAPSGERLNAHALSQICIVADVDEGEIFDLVGMEY